MTTKSEPPQDEQTPRSVDEDYTDVSAWPLVRVLFPPLATKNGLDLHFGSLAELVRRNEDFVVVINLDQLSNQSRELRKQAATRIRVLHEMPGVEHVLGVAHVSDNWLSRASLTVVLSLSPPPYPHRVFKRQDPAESWLRTLLQKAN